MAYNLTFKKDALLGWYALDNGVREQFNSKLEERIAYPHVLASKLSEKEPAQNQTPQYGY